MAHFFYVHGGVPTYFKNIFEGHVATQYMNSESRADIGGATVRAYSERHRLRRISDRRS
jgi:3-ketosteroid 9alpha-monooxygenase subunit A